MAEIDDLQRLAEMRDKGDLSQEEYEQLKAQLLSGGASMPQTAVQADTGAAQMSGQTRLSNPLYQWNLNGEVDRETGVAEGTLQLQGPNDLTYGAFQAQIR